MATYTGNLNLKKPTLSDPASISDINENMDILDAAVLPVNHVGKELWTGSWDNGNITVPDTDKYTMFLITMSGQGTVVPAIKYGTYIRGVGGYDSGTSLLTYHFGATFSGDTWTFVGCDNVIHNSEGNHGNRVACTVSSIIGLI